MLHLSISFEFIPYLGLCLSLSCLRFIRSEEDDKDSSWEQRLVKRYYDKLFKEYPLQVAALCISQFFEYLFVS